MMDEPTKSSVNLRWIIIVVLLLAGIDGLLTRVLETLWVSLRGRGSPAYLPLEWWMSAPFTVLVFALLSALLTSFSTVRNWLKTFLLLCGFKLLFAGVTAVFFLFRTYPDTLEASLHATFLSLPSVLIHIFLSAVVVMFLKDAFAPQPTTAEPAFPYLEGAEGEEAPVPTVGPAAKPSGEFASAAVGTGRFDRLASRPPYPMSQPAGSALAEVAEEAPEAPSEAELIFLPTREVLKCFPKTELCMSPSEIEELAPTVPIPLETVLPQLSEGRIVVEALAVISSIPPDGFAHSPQEVARKFPEGKMELPLREVVRCVPADTFKLPHQRFQPDVDEEFSDPFRGPLVKAAEEIAEKAPAAIEEPSVEEAPLPERAAEAVRPLPEDALRVLEEERLLFERSREVIEVCVESIISQFPRGAIAPRDSAQPRPAAGLPHTFLVPLQLIVPQLPGGEAKLKAKHVLAQFPEGCLSISEADIIRSLPNGEIELPLREIVPQLPPEVLAPPEQIQQPALEDFPDAFLELPRLQPVEEVKAPPVKEKPKPERVPQPPKEKKPALPPYEVLLREANPLSLSLNTVINLLPKGAFRVSEGELKRYIGGEAVNVPRSMVMPQLKEGRVVVPVEVFTAQFAAHECLGMSVEQIKARFAEGVVELPLPEIVRQVMHEVAQTVERQKPQPVCEEISTPFEEIPPLSSQRALRALRLNSERFTAESAETAEGEPLTASATVPGPEAKPAELPISSQRALRPLRLNSERFTAESAETAEGEPLTASADGPETARTILRTLIQKCHGLGFSEHVSFSAVAKASVPIVSATAEKRPACSQAGDQVPPCIGLGDYSAIILAPTTLNREAAAAGMIEMMAQIRRFCGDYTLGEPFKLVVSSTGGAIASAELVRGEANRLIILASLDRSATGVMSLLLDRFESELQELSALSIADFDPRPLGRAVNLEAKGAALLHDGLPEDVCQRVVAALGEVGIQNYLSVTTSPEPSREGVSSYAGSSLHRTVTQFGTHHGLVRGLGFRVLLAWGEGNYAETVIGKGMLDLKSLARYCSDVRAGEFDSLLIVTPDAKVTLNRSSINPNAFLLCLFPTRYGEGLIRAKAGRAAKLL